MKVLKMASIRRWGGLALSVICMVFYLSVVSSTYAEAPPQAASTQPELQNSAPAQAVPPASVTQNQSVPENAKPNIPVPGVSPQKDTPTHPPVVSKEAPAEENFTPIAISPSIAEPEQSLEQLYRQNRERKSFASWDYLLRVFGTLAALLGAFYFGARLILPKWFSPDPTQTMPSSAETELPLTQQATTKPVKKSLLGALFPASQSKDTSLRPKVLSRTRLAPAKEIYVVQVEDRKLIIGATAQQMTLLSEICNKPVETQPSVSLPPSRSRYRHPSSAHENAAYKKYLTPPTSAQTRPSIPEEEEVFLLSDYEDQYDNP